MSNDFENTIRPSDPDAENTMRPPLDAENTMRPPVDAEKTMRPTGDAEKTMRPTGDAEKTMRPTGDAEKTMRPTGDAEKTMRPDQQKEKEKIVNQQFTEFELGKVKYQVVKTISEGTGEAQIFLVESKGRQFALKLYYMGITPPPDHDIMERVRKAAGTGLLVDTFDHGKWKNPQSHEERDYELMEYCAGGSLDQLKLGGNEKLLGEIALRAASSLDFLHKQHILHRDVKPANFFFRKPGHNVDDMALADFGIAIPSDKEGKAVIDFQLRTKIYAAPEFYDMADGKIQISTKSDFYSLGMMLLTLLNGEEIFKLNEFELINMKKHGKLPYPKNVDDRTLQLIKALTLPDPNARAGFDEVRRWAAGEIIYEQEKDDVRKFQIVYNPTKNQTATSPEELAAFMLDDAELAKKYLYSGKISKWLGDNLRPDLEIDIETFVEKTYPKDQEAGFWATVYRLDEGMPYVGYGGQTGSSPQEIAAMLKTHFDGYCDMLGIVPHPDLFLFFDARGMANVTKEFLPKFKGLGNENRDALLQLIHTLDRTLPWTVVSYDGKTSVDCYKPEDVIQVRYDHGISDQSWADLLGEGFLTWLRYTAPEIEGKVRSAPGTRERQTAVLYNLSPKVAYNFQLDETAGDYFFTASEVGNYMNIQMEKYIQDKENSYASGQLDMMLKIDDTRLWDYLKSKGVYDDKIAWIKYCADLKSKDNLNKPGPYGWDVAVYKAIKGLGFDPWYYFPKSDKRVYNLDELDAIPRKEVKEELPKFFLQSWMTIFYQENPDLNLKKKYTFEKETIKYLEHLRRLDPATKNVEIYDKNKKLVTDPIASLKRKRSFHIFSKVVVGLLFLAAAGFTIFKLLTSGIHLDVTGSNAGWITIVSSVFGIGAFLIMWGSEDKGCLVNLIVGAIAYWAIFAILYFATPYLAYILAGLLLVTLIYVLVSCYFKYRMFGKAHRKLFKPTFEELEVGPLQQIFSENYNSDSSTAEESAKYGKYLSGGTKKLYRSLIFPLILMIGAGFLIYFAGERPEKPKPELPATATTVTVTAGTLNLRAAASSSAEVVKGLSKGQVLTVTGQAQGGWLPVEFEGSRGYVSTDYVTLSGVAEPAPSSPAPAPQGRSQAGTSAGTSAGQTQTTPAATPEPTPEPAQEPQAKPEPQSIAPFEKTFSPRPQATFDGGGVKLFVHRATVRGDGKFYLIFTGAATGDGGDGVYTPFWNNMGDIKLTDLDNPSRTWTPTGQGEDENFSRSTTGFYLVFEGVTGSRFSLKGSGKYIFNEIDIR